METRSNYVMVGAVTVALLAGVLLFIVWLAGLVNLLGAVQLAETRRRLAANTEAAGLTALRAEKPVSS